MDIEYQVFLFLKCRDQAAKCAKVRRITKCTFKKEGEEWSRGKTNERALKHKIKPFLFILCEL